MRIRKQKSIMDRAHAYVESVADTVIPQLEAALESAREKAGPALSDARDKAAPVIADARGRAVPLLHDARDRTVPMLVEGRALATEKAAASREYAAALATQKAAASREFAAAKAAQLRHEPEPRGSKLKAMLLLAGLLAIGAAVFARLRQRSSSDNWQSSYTPTPAPSAAAPKPTLGDDVPVEGASTGEFLTAGVPNESFAPGGTPTDDVAGGAPGEALSDAAETPHQVTTPDAPAEIIDIDDAPERRH